jgi:TetR/AcrR family transcriptional repressor of nem operon
MRERPASRLQKESIPRLPESAPLLQPSILCCLWRVTVRDRIKAVATDLFIAHGIRGLTFGMLAERLGVPRPNIHYYFANKQVLAEEVLNDYAAGVVALYSAIWTVTDLTLPAKFSGSMVAIRERYRRFNPSGSEGRPWGLLTRFQHEHDALTPSMLETLKKSGSKLDQCGIIAVRQGVARGELVPGTPQDEVSLLVINAIRFTGALTTKDKTFHLVEDHYRAVCNLIGKAYGTRLYRKALAEQASAGRAAMEEAGAD